MNLNRVLFVGYLWPGSSCNPRLNGLRAIGLDVEALDASSWERDPFWIVNSIGHRLYCTPVVRKTNSLLINAVARSQFDVVWLEKGNWVYPSTLRQLREHTRFLVHYNTDDVFASRNWFWLHKAGIHLYDLHLTTNRWNVLELRERYGVKVFRVGMGYDQDVPLPIHPCSRDSKGRDIVFVGHWEPHTERYISVLREAGVQVHVWGHNWRKAKDRSLRSVKPLPHPDYAETISSAKIGLCVLSRFNRNESTGRSFEIPAMGTFMLAERTSEHEFLYEDYQGAVLFSGENDLVEKARHYLEDTETRRSIAKNGLARSRELGLSWGDHIGCEWRLLERILTTNLSEFSPADDFPFRPGFRDGSPWERIGQSK